MLARSGAARLFRIGLAVVLLGLGIAPGESTVYASGVPNCRFGVVGVPPSLSNQTSLLQQLGVGNYLDGGIEAGWEYDGAGIEYSPVIKLHDISFPLVDTDPGLQALKTRLGDHPGRTWLIGYEPDNPSQDNLAPEDYAGRYYAVATWMRHLDPAAKLGFGSITQPSPLRLRYLDRAWQALLSLAGSRQAASGLVDVWSIHVYIRNEGPGGIDNEGIPPGMDPRPGEAYDQVDLNLQTSVSFFEGRITALRQQIALIGEQEKPLWLTGYGVWSPSMNDSQNQQVSTFMANTFSYFQDHQDFSVGMLLDGSRLVQRWFWYSLNGPLNIHSGSIYYPINPDPIITDPIPGSLTPLVGVQFQKYLLDIAPDNDAFVAGMKIRNISYQGAGQPGLEQITIRVGNGGSNGLGSALSVAVWSDVNDDPAHLVGSETTIVPVPGCLGLSDITFPWQVNPYESHTLYVHVALAPDTGNEANLANNDASFPVITGPPRILLPLVSR